MIEFGTALVTWATITVTLIVEAYRSSPRKTWRRRLIGFGIWASWTVLTAGGAIWFRTDIHRVWEKWASEDKKPSFVSPSPLPSPPGPIPSEIPPRHSPTPTATSVPTATAALESSLKRDTYWIRLINDTKAQITFSAQNPDDTWSIFDLQPRERQLLSWNSKQERTVHLKTNSLRLPFDEQKWQPPAAALFSSAETLNESAIPEYHFQITAEKSICLCVPPEDFADQNNEKKIPRALPVEDEFCAKIKNDTGLEFDIDVEVDGEWQHRTVIPKNTAYYLGGSSRRIRFRHREEHGSGWEEFTFEVDAWPCGEKRLPSFAVYRSNGKFHMRKL